MYELSQAAAADIEGLLENSMGQFGFEQTQIYYQSLRRCLELLAGNPAMRASADDIRPGYCRFPHRSHVVFYRQEDDGIFIVRILHRRMDVVSHLAH